MSLSRRTSAAIVVLASLSVIVASVTTGLFRRDAASDPVSLPATSRTTSTDGEPPVLRLQEVVPDGPFLTPRLRTTIAGSVSTDATLTIDGEEVLARSDTGTTETEFAYQLWLELGENRVDISASNAAGTTLVTIEPIVLPGLDVQLGVITAANRSEVTFTPLAATVAGRQVAKSRLEELQSTYRELPPDVEIAEADDSAITVSLDLAPVVLVTESEFATKRVPVEEWLSSFIDATDGSQARPYWLLIDRATDSPVLVQIQEIPPTGD